MLITIKGYYEDGQVILKEPSPVSEKTEVMITFLNEQKKDDQDQKRIPGGLKGKVAIPDNFNEPLEDLKDYM